MNISQRISAFDNLGKQLLKKLESGDLDTALEKAYLENRWFTVENSKAAIRNIAINFLVKDKLEHWLSNYIIVEHQPISIGVVMAGNIPLVGWHDAMSVLLTGNNLQAKLSSKDSTLIELFLKLLCEIEPAFQDFIETPERLKNFDAVIATGSGNTARYFEYYFGKYPHIIRRNRTSVVVLSGNESKEDLLKLGADIFTYFGLGCRNVSHLFVPKGYDLPNLLNTLEVFKKVAEHNKYFNNYEYYKSLLLLNKDEHLDNGFLILKEDNALASPVSSLNYSYYNDVASLEKLLVDNEEQIQCIAGKDLPIKGLINFGDTQHPQLNQYADNVDTVANILQWKNSN